MKKMLLLFCILALSVAGSSVASGQGQWFHHTLSNAHVTCNQSNTTPNTADAGPFASKDICLASDNTGGENPPPVVDPSGWPSTTGTLDGDATGGCGAPVVLTSDESAPGWAAFNFDIAPGTLFGDLGVDFDFAILAGTQAQSEPYLIVRFTDDTQVFVYSVDVNPGEPGEQVYSITGNTYITRAQALSQIGDKTVASATLAVDNGDLSIQVNGVTVDGCDSGEPGATTEVPYNPPTETWLCYSMFQRVAGVWPSDQASTLIAQGYWEAEAVLGNVYGGNNVGAYHMTCNSVAQGYHFTGKSLGDAGAVYGADYGPAREEMGFYPIFG